MLVVLLHFELAGSFRSIPTENLDKFTPPLPEREKFFTGIPWIPISGERECCKAKNTTTGRISLLSHIKMT
jgi:hypothetical protein